MAKERAADFDETSEQVASPPPKKGKKILLGIGIDQYTNWSALNNAVKDMETMTALLNERYDFDKLICIKDKEATADHIEDVLYQFTDENELGPDDSLLIYYSGHGYLDPNKKGYWVPVNAQKGKISTYLPNTRIRDIMSDMKAQHVLLISDSCYSGSLFPRTRGDNDTLNLVAADLERRRSRWAFCSGREDQKVSDGNDHSPFAKALIQELRLNENGKIPVQFLAAKVMAITRNNYNQLPECGVLVDTGDMGGQFVFTLRNYVPQEGTPTAPVYVVTAPTTPTRGDDNGTSSGGGIASATVPTPTTRKELAAGIETLLIDGQLSEAIQLILDFNDPGLSRVRDSAVLLSGRWRSLQREDSNGAISTADFNVQKAKISNSVMAMRNDIYQPTPDSDLGAFKAELKTMIGNAQTDLVIKKLKAANFPELTPETKNSIELISSEYQKLNRQVMNNIIDPRDARVQTNSINYRLLELIDGI